MVNTKIENKYIIYFEGEMDESVLVFFIKKISDNKKLPNKIKSSLKFVLIELITNMISHYSSNPYGIISVQKLGSDILISSGNYVSNENLKKIRANLNLMNKISNVKGHYNDLLKSVSYDKSVNLGLIEIYNRCKGNIKLNTTKINEQQFLTIKITLNDTN